MVPLLASGSSFAGRYEIIRLLSQGGMGAVYEVIHSETRRRRALKVMLPELVGDEIMRRRFLLEARVTAEVESENLVETFDAGIDTSTNQPFLVMELLKGAELGSKLERERLTWHEVIAILEQVARGLDKTHAANIVHRDLKPENVFISAREDGSLLVKILDFGIAKVLSESVHKKTTRSVGTPLYIAPETLQHKLGPISAAVDRYALAHMAYAMLVSEAYFETEGRETESILALLTLIGAGPTELPSERAKRSGAELGPAFDVWFMRAANPRPELRFATCREQIEELRALCEREPPVLHGGGPAVARSAEISNAETVVVAEPAAALSGPLIELPVERPGTPEKQKHQLAASHTRASAPEPSSPSKAPQTKDFTVEIESGPKGDASSRRVAVVGALVVLAAAAGAFVILSLRDRDPTTVGAQADSASASAASGSAASVSVQPTAAAESAASPITVSVASAAQTVSASGPTGLGSGGLRSAGPVRDVPSAKPVDIRKPATPTKATSAPDCSVDPTRCR